MNKAAINLKRLFVTYLFERRYFNRTALCALVSEKDAEVLRKVCPRVKHVVIPNGVDSDYFKPLELPEDFPSLIFEGNMGFSPSIDAVLYFCREIFPLIQERISEVKFYIVGKNPSGEVRNLGSEQIFVTGYVDDVRLFLDRASVFVCPMRKGAGIKNKVLQAWAMAKPVVATSVALGGLRVVPDENIIVADGAKSFAQKVVRLLENPHLREKLGRGGRETVREHYSWERQARSLEGALRSL